MLAALQKEGEQITATVIGVLSDTAKAANMIAHARMSAGDRELASTIVAEHSNRMAEAKDQADQKAKARSFLKPLRERRAVRGRPHRLTIGIAPETAETIADILSSHPEKDRLKDIRKSQRIMAGVTKWPLGWLRGPGVVCYERAAGRIKNERHGRPDAEFMKGVVKQEALPTAVASASDHYVVLQPQHQPRFMSVNEVARAFAVPEGGLMSNMLTATTTLSVNQA